MQSLINLNAELIEHACRQHKPCIAFGKVDRMCVVCFQMLDFCIHISAPLF